MTGFEPRFRGSAQVRARLADGLIVFKPQRFAAEGDFVVMQAKTYATAKSGAPYNNPYCIVARIVDGQIREMTDYVDTALISDLLGKGETTLSRDASSARR
jgi:ketosteroid isomerase-like protein